jgi:hypothetical protein
VFTLPPLQVPLPPLAIDNTPGKEDTLQGLAVECQLHPLPEGAQRQAMGDQCPAGKPAGAHELHCGHLVAGGEGRGADEVDAAVVHQVHVYRRRAVVPGEPSEQQNPSALSDHPHALRHRFRGGIGGNHHVGAVPIGEVTNSTDRFDLRGIDQGVRPELTSETQPTGAAVDEDHLVCPLDARERSMDAAHRACPQDHDGVTYPDLRFFVGVEA